MRLLSPWLIAAAVIAAPAGAATKRGITPEDYFAFESISDAHISPDGKQVAYVLITVDQKRNLRDNSIWVVSIDGHCCPARSRIESIGC
jgi:dipeptidyl aminopeptidase/acylaminoacyl peptidase